MKLPRKVEIYGSKYKLKIFVNPHVQGIPVEGYCDSLNKIICLSRDILKDKEFTMEVLIHEMGHALMDRMGVRLTQLPPELEEIIVQAFAIMLIENFDIKLK